MTFKRILLMASCLLFPLLGSCTKGQEYEAYKENQAKNFNYLCGIDQFGRPVQTMAGYDKGKDIGVFYFLWHGESGTTTYNNTLILKEDPDDLFNLKGSKTSPMGAFHYWDEPIFGYYRSDDKWVIAKHCELLTQAGVDFLVFDTTNAFTYEKSYLALMEVFTAYQEKGWDVPKIAFYTNSLSIRTMNSLYENLYKKGLYQNLWYCPDGQRPLIIGALTAEEDKKIHNDPNYNPQDLSEEFLNFFDLRGTQWPFDPVKDDAFPWMEWTYPQPNHNGVMSVSLAQHPQLPFSDSYFDRNKNMGRGYDFIEKINIESESAKGLNHQMQWNTVLSNKDDVHTVFVTGWNEWIAIKMEYLNKVAFVDCFNEEFSRDIEPSKNGTYQDAFYLQLIDNIRRFRAYNSAFTKAVSKTIDIDVDSSNWDDVTNVYHNIGGLYPKRNSFSVDRKDRYLDEGPTNIIEEVRVTHDKDNIYFMIKTKDDIKIYNQENFMNILIGTGQVKIQGFESYNICIGRQIDGKKIAVSTLDEKGNTSKYSDAQYTIKGNIMQVEIKRKDLNLSKKDSGFYFKVADSVVDYKDIMDYYVTGSCFPMGRLSYYYYLK